MQARADRTGPTPQRPWFQVCQYGSSNAWLWHSTYRYEKGEVRTSPFRHPWDLPPLRLDRVIAHRVAILQVPPSNMRTSHTGPFRPPERAPRINRQRSSQLPRPARPPRHASLTGSPAPSGGCARSAPGRPRARRSRRTSSPRARRSGRGPPRTPPAAPCRSCRRRGRPARCSS